MMILCIKPVVLRIRQKIVFTMGTTYEATITNGRIEAKNDEGNRHLLFRAPSPEARSDDYWDCKDAWDWFVEHFA